MPAASRNCRDRRLQPNPHSPCRHRPPAPTLVRVVPSLRGGCGWEEEGRPGSPLPWPPPHLTGLSSVSSPSELSDGTFSVTSAYSSAPDGSPPPAPLPASEMAVEEIVPGPLSAGAPEAPLFLMDCEAANPHGPAPSPPPLPPAPEGGAAVEEADSPPAVDVIPVRRPWLELRGGQGLRHGSSLRQKQSGFGLGRRRQLPLFWGRAREPFA